MLVRPALDIQLQPELDVPIPFVKEDEKGRKLSLVYVSDDSPCIFIYVSIVCIRSICAVFTIMYTHMYNDYVISYTMFTTVIYTHV
jgi:hypothetical protein